MNFKSLFKTALVAVTILYAFGASAQNAVFPSAQIDLSGNVFFPGGPTLGVYSHGVFTPTIPPGTPSAVARRFKYHYSFRARGNLSSTPLAGASKR